MQRSNVDLPDPRARGRRTPRRPAPQVDALEHRVCRTTCGPARPAPSGCARRRIGAPCPPVCSPIGPPTVGLTPPLSAAVPRSAPLRVRGARRRAVARARSGARRSTGPAAGCWSGTGTRGSPRHTSGRAGTCRPPTARSWKNSSVVTGTNATSEVSFSIAIVSLPVGGMMTRIACGRTIRRSTGPAHAERLGGLGLARVDRLDAGPDDLGHVGRLGQRQREHAGGEPGQQRGASTLKISALRLSMPNSAPICVIERQAEPSRAQRSRGCRRGRAARAAARPGRTRCRARRRSTGSGSATTA